MRLPLPVSLLLLVALPTGSVAQTPSEDSIWRTPSLARLQPHPPSASATDSVLLAPERGERRVARLFLRRPAYSA